MIAKASSNQLNPTELCFKKVYFIPLRWCGSLLPNIIVANITDTDTMLVQFTEVCWEPLLVVYMRALHICLPCYLLQKSLF